MNINLKLQIIIIHKCLDRIRTVGAVRAAPIIIAAIIIIECSMHQQRTRKQTNKSRSHWQVTFAWTRFACNQKEEKEEF